MKQEDKELLFKDICARLPYKVKVSYYDNENERQECDVVDLIYEDTQEIGVGQWCLKMDKFKPYLFPMSRLSMTDEQKIEYQTLWYKIQFASQPIEFSLRELNKWLLKNHFDVNGLIPIGLAIDATNLNIY